MYSIAAVYGIVFSNSFCPWSKDSTVREAFRKHGCEGAKSLRCRRPRGGSRTPATRRLCGRSLSQRLSALMKSSPAAPAKVAAAAAVVVPERRATEVAAASVGRPPAAAAASLHLWPPAPESSQQKVPGSHLLPCSLPTCHISSAPPWH